MKKHSLPVALFLWFGPVLFAQEIRSLTFAGATVIAHDTRLEGSVIGGLSGITYHPESDRYYLVADKYPARMFRVRISVQDSLIADFQQVIKLTPALLQQAELEGIAFNPVAGNFIVSDEQGQGTRIFTLTPEGRFMHIIEPVNQGFLPLSNHNSGIEGLTVSHKGNTLYYAFEKPIPACQDNALVQLTRLSSDNRQRQNFWYPLHAVAHDKIPTNGISEILYLTDSSLLVMERAYIPDEGNVVRIYRVQLPIVNDARKTSCTDPDVTPLTPELLFDFATVKSFAIDNAEGMAFNADRSLLLLVTDNNFSKKQQTQLVALRVGY